MSDNDQSRPVEVPPREIDKEAFVRISESAANGGKDDKIHG